MDQYSSSRALSYTAGERVRDDRRFWKFIVFGFLTAGIYMIYYWYTMVNDMNEICRPVEPDDEDRSPNYLIVVLLSIITFGIYGLIWWYRQGNRLNRAGRNYGVTIDEKGSTYILWILLGTWLAGAGAFIAPYLLTKNVNRLARAYNYKYFEQGRAQPETPDIPATSYTPTSGDTTSFLAKGVLYCESGEYKGCSFPVGSEGIVIGRSGQYSQLILSDPTVSRKHCTVKYPGTDNNFYVTDHSSMGTVLNGSMRLTKEVPRKCPGGSCIKIGNSDNVFRLM